MSHGRVIEQGTGGENGRPTSNIVARAGVVDGRFLEDARAVRGAGYADSWAMAIATETAKPHTRRSPLSLPPC